MDTMKRKRTAALFCLLIMLAAVTAGCGGQGSAEPEGETSTQLTDTGIAEAVPGLDKFMGGWGSLDCRETGGGDCSVAEFTDDGGKLKVSAGTYSGGGYYAVFEAEDITIDGDTMTCVNGLFVADGLNVDDAILVASPSDAEEGGYTFVFSNEGGELKESLADKYVFTKVGNTNEELMDWVNEHHEPL